MSKNRKNRSLTLDRAEARAASLAAFEPPLQLGGVVSLADYQAKLAEARAQLARYNGLLAEAEEARAAFIALEKVAADYSARILATVAGQYGRNHPAYAAAGGTLLAARKRQRKAAPGGEKLPDAA